MKNDVSPDYDTLIDTQTRAFIELTDSWYPPNTTEFSLQLQREIYDNMCSQFHCEYPAGVSAADAIIPSEEYAIPVRRYSNASEPQNVLIIYFHGGGFVVGGLESHDAICAELCKATGYDVTAVDYRLAPEHLHPAAFNDSLASVIYESNRTNAPVILCGDSAGGNLAAAVSHTLRDSTPAKKVPVAGQVLIYPALGGDTSKGSYITHANAPLLTTREVHFYSTIRSGHSKTAHAVCSIATHSPLKDTNFSNLPETVAFSAACDPLADDGKHYVALIQNAGGVAIWINEDGLVHGYLRARSTVDRARESFARIVEALLHIGTTAPV